MNTPVINGNPMFYGNVTFNIRIQSVSSDNEFPTDSKSRNDKIKLYVKEAEEKDYEDHKGKEHIYQIVGDPKGRALVINNEFKNTPDVLKGAELDGDRMKQLWEKIGCHVTYKHDLTANEISTVVKDFVKLPADFCVIVIMSHGGKDDVVLGFDKNTSPAETIVNSVANSKALKGKPKLLFFAMCRGTEVAFEHTDSASIRPEDSVSITDLLKQLLPRSRLLGEPELKIGETSAGLVDDEVDAAAEDHLRVHGTGDMLLAFSTQPGFVAFHDPVNGSWFIEDLAEVFAKRAHKEDVITMMEEVRKRVSEREAGAPGEKHNRGVASVDGSNTFEGKKLYLFPGFPRTH